MKTILVVPTLNRYDLLNLLLDDLLESDRRPDKTIIIDNGGSYEADERFGLLDLSVLRFGSNLGVAGSVNKAMELCIQSGSWWMHSNDDVRLRSDTLDKLIGYAEEHRSECKFYVPESGIGKTFTVILADPKYLIETVGWMDTQFYPAYFEDNDLAYRMNLANVKRIYVPGSFYEHAESSTLKAYSPEQLEAHHASFRANRAKYVAKWGGEPEFEKFRVPYGGYPVLGEEIPGI